jgi:hypothetical protein
MNHPNSKFRKMFIVVCLTSNLIANANNVDKSDFPHINLSAETVSIKIGEPLLLKLAYKYDEPKISPLTGEISEEIRHFAYLKIEHHEGSFSTDRFPIFPIELLLQDTQGLEYSGQFVFFYHSGEKRLIFPKPGTYIVTIRGWTKVSNPLNIIVKPTSELQRRALSLLSDPNDYLFLEFGTHEFKEKRSERMLHLTKVVEKCEGAVLAEWAAARLGLEYFEEFHKKHPSFQKFKALRDKGKVKEPLFEQARKYLEIGAKLPDEFPIREDVLRQLIRIEYMDGNDTQAFLLIDELSTKYPKGKYGRKAPEWKKELLELQKRGPK